MKLVENCQKMKNNVSFIDCDETAVDLGIGRAFKSLFKKGLLL